MSSNTPERGQPRRNKEAFDQLIDAMEDESRWGEGKLIFWMGLWKKTISDLVGYDRSRLRQEFGTVPRCGTVCCIGGTAQIALKIDRPYDVHRSLGLSFEEGYTLFYPGAIEEINRTAPEGVTYHTIFATKEQCISLLKAIRDGKAECIVGKSTWKYPTGYGT